MEGLGRLTSDVPSKYQKDQNVFMLVTAPEASLDRDIEALAAFDLNNFIRDTKAKMCERSVCGIRILRNIFRAMDTAGSGVLELDDFRWGLIDYGLSVTKEDVDNVANGLGSTSSVDFNAFLSLLMTGDSEAKAAVIEKAYKKLEEACNGKVTLDGIAQNLDGSALPDVVSGKKSEQDAYMEIMSLFDTQIKDGIVSLDEFKDFMCCIGCAIESDEAFAAAMTA